MVSFLFGNKVGKLRKVSSDFWKSLKFEKNLYIEMSYI